MPDTNLKIWTIGHFSHPLDDFAGLLTQHRIAALMDVRRFPGSRTFPQFNRESLGASLAELGIDYRWIEALGGRRPRSIAASPNEGWQNKSFRNYADHMLSEEFQAGFQELIQCAIVKRTAIMCSESVYWRCHRRLISDYVVAQGGSVEHIFPDGRTKPHAMTEMAKIDSQAAPTRITYPPAPTLFD
ncbi:MAG: DUF488 family protein [Novipirellula sp. JB048]